MNQGDLMIVSDYRIRILSGLYYPDKGYFGQNHRAREKAVGWEKKNEEQKPKEQRFKANENKPVMTE
ncbi:wound-inducible basic family protein [Medicago truncatula]|uniref:Wound-inducible basic family protein n=1 Tax=Medicago truncatula TaxID=3880 RepID=A0A072TZE8_MEDTR|nr:wound-inducible basic family protein [Medicago truncatula]